MNIDSLTIGEVKQIRALLGNVEATQSEPVNHGFCIAVLDRGFVYVGDVVTDGRFVKITNARNLRRWGTQRGLGQLALEGPLSNTVLDECGDIVAPISELKHIMVSEVTRWN